MASVVHLDRDDAVGDDMGDSVARAVGGGLLVGKLGGDDGLSGVFAHPVRDRPVRQLIVINGFADGGGGAGGRTPIVGEAGDAGVVEFVDVFFPPDDIGL